jgi:hypothetical protein
VEWLEVYARKKKQQNAVSRSLSETVRAQVSEMPIWQVRL